MTTTNILLVTIFCCSFMVNAAPTEDKETQPPIFECGSVESNTTELGDGQLNTKPTANETDDSSPASSGENIPVESFDDEIHDSQSSSSKQDDSNSTFFEDSEQMNTFSDHNNRENRDGIKNNREFETDTPLNGVDGSTAGASEDTNKKVKREIDDDDAIDEKNNNDLDEESQLEDDMSGNGEYFIRNLGSNPGSFFGDEDDETDESTVDEKNSQDEFREKREIRGCHDSHTTEEEAEEEEKEGKEEEETMDYQRFKRRMQMGFLHKSKPSYSAINGSKPTIDDLFKTGASEIRRSSRRQSSMYQHEE